MDNIKLKWVESKPFGCRIHKFIDKWAVSDRRANNNICHEQRLSSSNSQ